MDPTKEERAAELARANAIVHWAGDLYRVTGAQGSHVVIRGWYDRESCFAVRVDAVEPRTEEQAHAELGAMIARGDRCCQCRAPVSRRTKVTFPSGAAWCLDCDAREAIAKRQER